MAVTARSVVYTMMTSVACKEVRDFHCLAIKYKKQLLGGLENALGDVSDASKIALVGGFGRGYPSRSILDQFWTPFWQGFWGLNRVQMGPEDEFQEAYASKTPLETIWNRFDIDFEASLERRRALS